MAYTYRMEIQGSQAVKRMHILSLLLLLVSWRSPIVLANAIKRPHIVFIMSDDMGWNDVSFHGSDQIQTPNIDALAYDGVALHRYYTHCSCTPSRAALLTGKYAHRTGMQGYPLTNSEDRGIPLSEKLLPEYLKELGYATHLVGKWHVGASRTAYLPTKRGFDSHFGYRAGAIDYYEYEAGETWTSGPVSGFDLFENMTAAWSAEGYLTDILTGRAVEIINSHDPTEPLYLHVAHAAPHCSTSAAALQAPPDRVRANRHVESPERRQFAGMMSTLDESVGLLVQALSDKQILNNTIIVFVSDNGGMSNGETRNWASNYPLRGQKMSPFEGGVRVSGLVWSSELKSGAWRGMMHVSDWLPTLVTAAGGGKLKYLDGLDQWSSILTHGESKRRKIITEIDDYFDFAAIIYGDYKMITGTVNENYSKYLGATDNFLGIIGSAPTYSDAVKTCTVNKALGKIGRGVNMSKIQESRDSMAIICTMPPEESCVPAKNKSCLYNIMRDPCEQHDLSAELPRLAMQLEGLAALEREARVPRPQVPANRDPRSNPRLHNNTWTPWLSDTT